jgi:membrane protease YdiL (CAAX protease family)
MFWPRLPVWLRAIVFGLLIALIAANVWHLLLVGLGAPFASITEIIFLSFYIWWAAGGGAPRSTQQSRAFAFRRRALTAAQWFWSIFAAIFFAVTIHAAIVLLFRFVPFPKEAFHHGYNLSFIPSLPLKWLAVVMSAASAGICEEIGFRGYMQHPIEQRYGAPAAILVSSLFFTLVHLNKTWATLAIVPIILLAGVLLGLLAWSAASLLPCIIGHCVMDIGLFAYWWTGIAGDFTARPIFEAGVDLSFAIACLVFVASLLIVLHAMSRLRRSAPVLK